MFSRRLAYVTLLSCLVACGKIPALDPGPADPCDQEDFDTDGFIDCYMSLGCELAVACDLFPDQVSCVQAFELRAEARTSIQRIRDSIVAGRIAIDQDKIDLCIDAIESRVAGGLCIFDDPDECARIFAGQVSGDATCYESNECEGPGSRCSGCEVDQQCCAGTCTRAAVEGASCAGGVPCESGLYCVGDADQATCQDGEAGAPCGTDDYNCDDGFFCNNGTCVADLTDDRACDRNQQCQEPLLCIQGTCQHAYEGDDCETDCEFGFVCQVPAEGGVGTCVALGNQVGDDCTQECLKGLVCVDGKCAERPGEGEPCQRYQCAFGLFCSAELDNGSEPVTGECAVPQVDGQPCNSSSHCASAVCQNGKCEAYQACE